MKKSSKVKILKGERYLYIFLLVFIVLVIPVFSLWTKATLTETNINVSKLRASIAKQKSINESLSMEINELASLGKIQEVARDLGLSYNEVNVKVIGE